MISAIDRDARDGRSIEPGDLQPGSRQVQAGGLRWQVEEMGQGPCVFMLHGTGASIHSWGLLAPLLARSCHLVMIDLPGHGLTSAPSKSHLSIEGMARAVAALLKVLEIEPDICVGHSAGAVVLLQMSLEQTCRPATIISLNGALLPFTGITSHLFAHFARLLAIAPLVPGLVSRRMGNRAAVDKLIGQLGSSIPAQQSAGYVRLLQSEKHISAALGMMANWDLKAFSERLSQLESPLDLVVCANDRAVPASQAGQLQKRLPEARLHLLAGLGHLGHEEDPEAVCELLIGIARERGVSL